MKFRCFFRFPAVVTLLLFPFRVHAVPTATNDSYNASEDVPLVIAAPGVLGNDVADPVGAILNAVVVAQPAHGAVALSANGSFTYTPAANYNGADSFTYKVLAARTFTVDRARSTVNVKAAVNIMNPALGEATDNKNGNIVGTAQVYLNPAAPAFQQIQIQDLDVKLDTNMTLSLSWFFGAATLKAQIDPTKAVDPDFLRIEMDQPGPAGAVAADGKFSQNGNLLHTTGRAQLTAGGLAANQGIPPTLDIDTVNPYDIAPIADEPAMGSPQITQVGSNLELKLPVKVTQTQVDPDGQYSATITVKGALYLTAPLNPIPQSATATVALSVGPVDDVPVTANDRYYTRRNVAISIPATAAQTTENLITAGSVWKYSTGADQGTAWRSPEFNDASWASGAGILGYSDPDIVTTIPARNDPAAPVNATTNPNYPTAYFRRDFTLTSPFDTVQPGVDLMRDDAAIVYVNGTEIYRDKDLYTGGTVVPLPATGNVPYSQYATATIPDTDEAVYKNVTFSRALLREGKNVVAVEVKQGSATSSDLRFDLKASRTRGVAGVLSNDTDLDGDVLTAQVATGPGHGTLALQAGGGFTYTPAPGFFGTDTFRYKVLQNGVPATKEEVIVTPGVESAAGAKPVWKYLDTGVDPGTAWKDAAFDDSAWKTGAAELGYGDGDETTVVEDNGTPGYSNTPNPADRYITTWFRKKITIPNAGAVTGLRVRARRDDGIAVYLNGSRIMLDNLTEPYTATKRANSSLGGTDETVFIERVITAPTMVLEGENTLSAEVHQFAPDSSDMSFDMGLSVIYAVTGLATIEVLDDDADGDLMSDTWERSVGLDATVANANDDPDGDGQSNRAEFLAGTDPFVPGSALRIQTLVPGAGSVLNLTFDSIPGHTYQLQRSTDLQIWTNSGSVFPAHATNPQTVVPFTMPAGLSQYLRIKLQDTWQ